MMQKDESNRSNLSLHSQSVSGMIRLASDVKHSAGESTSRSTRMQSDSSEFNWLPFEIHSGRVEEAETGQCLMTGWLAGNHRSGASGMNEAKLASLA